MQTMTKPQLKKRATNLDETTSKLIDSVIGVVQKVKDEKEILHFISEISFSITIKNFYCIKVFAITDCVMQQQKT